jgi:hypothetical protein
MKKIGLVALIVLALNFLAVAGGVGWLVGAGKLDKDKARDIGKVLFPDPPAPATQPAKDARDPATTQPMLRFDELLQRQTGKTAAEQVAFLRETFDTMSASLDRQRRELFDLKRQVDFAQAQVSKDRTAIEARAKSLDDREQRQRAQDADEGFQKTLDVYNTMDIGQVKDLFMKLDEQTVVRYLQAMEPRRASRIVKEFTTPEELSKAQSLLESMRKNDALPEAKNASSDRPSQASSK